jgi:D-alanyl-lipoteichoic acid acyltransferase DltB (MBOAT superfamily)
MLFNSFSFAIFLPVVFLVYYALPHRFRVLFLLLASCYFYMAFVPAYVLIMFAVITVDYFLAPLIHKHVGKKRALFLTGSIVINLGILFFFKYFNFFNQNIDALADVLNFNYAPMLLSIALPLGLSFHIFQSLSYVIEVYKGKYEPEKNYIRYALYVMFFPQLVAGPIERPAHLLPQLRTPVVFNAHLARQGLERILWGFFKKLVIADQLAQVINPLFASNPTEGALILALAILFTIQIYCDFSGYSDIALGTAMLLGFNLTENFNRPFAAVSFADFWRRWHMSLSNWLRDYLYYPLALGWGKVSKTKLYLSLLTTFTLIGLWHGANWTFVVFGFMHGMYLFIELLTERFRKKIVSTILLHKVPLLHKTIQVSIVFLGTALSFLVFRSESMSQATLLFTNLVSNFSVSFAVHDLLPILTKTTGTIVFFAVFLATLLMFVIEYYQEKHKTFFIFDALPRQIRYGWYYILMVGIVFFGYFGAQSFIYFQF